MKSSRFSSSANKRVLVAVAVTAALGLMASTEYATPAHAQAAPAPAQQTVRPEVGKPLTAAQAFFRDKKYPEALAELDKAIAVPMRTSHETYVIERTRSAVAATMNDNALMAKAVEAVLATSAYPAEEKLLLMDTLTKTYFRLKEHTKVVEWGLKTLAEPGVSNDLRLLVAQSAFASENLDVAKTQLSAVIETTEKSGAKPPEAQYRLLANIALRQKDDAAYARIIEKLATQYYKKEYLADLLGRVYTKSDFPEKLMIDVRRLRFAMGAAVDGNEYFTLAQLVFRGGFPAEAKKILDEGVSKGVFKDDNAERKAFRDQVEKEFAEEQKQAGRPATASKDPNATLNNGFNFVILGQPDKGLPLMEQAIANSALKNPEESKLRLGIAYTTAGNKAKAIETFKSVGGAPGLVELARMWSIFAAQLPG